MVNPTPDRRAELGSIEDGVSLVSGKAEHHGRGHGTDKLLTSWQLGNSGKESAGFMDLLFSF